MKTHGKFPALARLLAPVSVDDFLAHYWEQRYLRVPATDRGPTEAPVTLAEIDAVLTGRPHHHPDLQLVDAARTVEVDEYARDDDSIDPVRAVKRFAAGATIVLNRLDEQAPRVRELLARLETELGIHVQANMYLTPRTAQGFPIHYDNHDVIIVQCEGRKRWRLFESPKVLPMRGERFEAAVTKPGAKTDEFVMETGDVLYVPRGLMHEALAEGDELSLHVTIGFHAVRWSEVLLEAIARAAVDDVELRKGIPLGALVDGTPDEALAAQLRGHAARVLDGVRWERVRDRVEAQYFFGHKERLGGLLLDAATELTLDTPLARRDGAQPALERQGDAVVLTVQGRATRWPAHAATTLENALAGDRFTARSLGDDLDEKGRLTLARRLLAEGAVRIAREP
ncbi:MAG: cupin domain-containing protein [Polyangiales bacterium]